MRRRQFLLGLIGIVAGSATLAVSPPVQAAASPLDLDRVLATAPDAEYSLLVGRLTHRRRAGGWWSRRVARARAWGRRGRPGRR